jgi:hypothetical protein
MRKMMAVAIAIMALMLLGAAGEEKRTKEGWPACLASAGPETFGNFMQAIARQDKFAIQFYMTQKGCGPMKPNMRAEILEEGQLLVKIRIHPEGHDPAVVYTIQEALY